MQGGFLNFSAMFAGIRPAGQPASGGTVGADDSTERHLRAYSGYIRRTTQALYPNRTGTVFEPYGCGMHNLWVILRRTSAIIYVNAGKEFPGALNKTITDSG